MFDALRKDAACMKIFCDPSSGEGDSVKNHTDVLIFHTAICAGASQIALMADEKSPILKSIYDRL